MKNKESHARTHEKQRTTMQKPMKHHEKTNENQGETMQKPMKTKEKQWKQMYPSYLSCIYVSFV